MSSSEEPLARGAEIAPGYEVLDHLSRGRMFDVYDVWSEDRLCRCVAKTIHPERLGERGAVARLEREARLLRRLAHPHVVRAYDFVREPRPVAILETLSGETLSHLVEEGGPLEPAEAGVLGLQLCSAIAYLHRAGIVHLDLKPSNIVAEAGRAKVIDLSVARRPGRARPGVGTWCYMAPEQAIGGLVGFAADVWGIGIVLHEALSGEPAFDDDGAETYDSLARPERYPQLLGPAPTLPPRVPAPLRSAVEACLEPDPARRPSLEQVWAELESLTGVPSLRALSRSL